MGDQLEPFKKMKVLWFSNTPANADEYFNSELKGSGGWLKSTDQLLQTKVDLHIAFYHDNNESFKYKGTTYIPIRSNRNIYTRILNRISRDVPNKNDLSKYLEIISQVNPDIIHIHGTENLFASILLHTNIPVVISIQGIITAIFYMYCAGFEKKYLHAVKRSAISLKDFVFPWSFNVEFRQFEKLHKLEVENLKIARNIMGRTAWDRQLTRILAPNSFYYHEDRILRASFYEHKWKPHVRDKIIIHTTNGNAFYKGFETLCMALNELNRISFNCEWRVAGINPNDLIVKITKQKLKNRYPQKGLILLGSINEKVLIENLLNSDMYVMTSHIENNANNLCEAMMLGMPCVSTFVGGMGSLINDKENGILIQNGDSLAMAGAILELINNKEEALKLGENARNVALIRHDKEKIINDITKAYDDIIIRSKNEY